MFSNFCHVLKKYILIILIIIGSLLILNHFCSYSRRIGNTRFYLVETQVDSNEGEPLAGLYYKPVAVSAFIGENTPGFPMTILWNDHYIISKNFDGNNPEIVEYVIINIDSINSDFGEMRDIHKFQDENAYYNYLKQIELSEDEMNKTDNHIVWWKSLY